MNRTIDEYMIFYKYKILRLIINNSGKYWLWDIESMFGINRDRLEEFISEYSRLGFDICIKKGRLFIRNSRDGIEVFIQTTKKQEEELSALLEDIWDKGPGAVNIDRVYKGFESPAKGKRELVKKLNCLERDGFMLLKDKNIFLLKPSFETLSDKSILKLLIFLNILRNLYPKRNILTGVYRKLMVEYGRRGYCFSGNAIQYARKNKMSLHEEIILNIVEDAIYLDKSLEFLYRTQVGQMNIKINPAGVIYNSQKDMWYVVTTEGRNTEYRMDKIINPRIVDGRAGHFVKNLYEYSMGISGENLIDVKAAFKKEAVIYKKLLSYTKLRKSAEIRETNNSYVLTDKVRGTNEFKKWLRAFGENAVCLQPDRLREEMHREVKLLKERYGVV